jgi:hypothetical protein
VGSWQEEGDEEVV